MINSGLIFEHFDSYLKDEDNDMQSPQGAYRLLREDAQLSDFTDTLTEDLDNDSRKVVTEILNRQRETLLTESANVAPSVFTHEFNHWV